MNRCIIDTDILSEFLRGNVTVRQHAEEYLHVHGHLNISIITYYEVLNGLLYHDAKKRLSQFEEFASLNRILPLTVTSVRLSADIQAKLRAKGRVIGHTDTLIAGIALANGLELVTNNTEHFSRVSGLKLRNWLDK